MNVRPFCIALLGLALAAPAAALDARDLMGAWYASGLTATTAEQDPTILELYLVVNLDGTIDIAAESLGEDEPNVAYSYGQCFQPRAATSNSTESNEDDLVNTQAALQIQVTGGSLDVTNTGSVNGSIQLSSGASASLGYDAIVLDDFRMNSTAELITGVTQLTSDRVMHMNMIKLPVDEDLITVPCLFDNCNVVPAPTATVETVNVAVGDNVAQGDALATVVGDQTQTLTSPVDGLVVRVDIEAGATVEFTQELMLIESPATNVSVIENANPKSQFAEGSWRLVGYFETIQDGGQDFPYEVPTPTSGPATWDVVSLNVEIGSNVVQGETLARLVPSGGGTQMDVTAVSNGVITDVYQDTSAVVMPDLGGGTTIPFAGGFGGLDYKVLCLGPDFFGADVCANMNPDSNGTPRQLERGDTVSAGSVIATVQLACCPGSERLQILAPENGVITQVDVEPCFGTFGGGAAPSSCSDAIQNGDALMSTEPEATLVDLLVTTNAEITAGQVIAMAQSEANGSTPVDIVSTASGRITEIFFDRWSGDIAYGTPLMTVQNFQLEQVAAGEELFVINEDPTCHPDFETIYEIRASAMGLCESATITSVGATPGQNVCAGEGNLVGYEYSCTNPNDTSGPPITGSKNDFRASADSIIETVNVTVGTVVRPGDLLLTFRRGSDTEAGAIDGSVRVYPGNEGQAGGLNNPHTGQLQTSTIEFTDSCDFQMANNAISSAQRVSRSLKGRPNGAFSFFNDPGGDWYFRVSKNLNFAIGNSVGFYLGGNFRHQNMLMVKGPEEAIHVPSLGPGDPAVELTSLHGLTPTDYIAYPPTPGSPVNAGDPIATLQYESPSGTVSQTLLSPIDGYVGEFFYAEGTNGIAYDQSLMTLRSSPAFPTPSNQAAETTWQVRGFTDRSGAILAGATRTGTLSVNANGDQLEGGSLQSSDGSPAQEVTGGGVELVIPPVDPLAPQPETTDGSLLFGTPGDPMTFAGTSTEETEALMLSYQRDVIAGVIEDSTGTTGFVVGMVPEPSARLLALAALGALGLLRSRLRGHL